MVARLPLIDKADNVRMGTLLQICDFIPQILEAPLIRDQLQIYFLAGIDCACLFYYGLVDNPVLAIADLFYELVVVVFMPTVCPQGPDNSFI